MSVFIGYPSFMAYQMMKGKKGNNDGFPSIPGMIARYSALGLTNEQMAENPVWKDLTGNGHDLQMKNFAWKGMSGVGGYVTNKDVYEYDLDHYSHPFIEYGTKVRDFYIVFELIGYDENFKDGFNLDVRSISQGLKYRKTYTKNGIYIFQYKDEEGLDDLFAIGYNGNGGARSNFTVKILPLYPGFILGDGVDDFAATEKELNFEDTYTVYTAFIPLQNDPIKNMIVCGKDYKKDFYINYGTQLVFYTANSTKSIPLHINQFTVLLCKRDKTTGVIKNLVTGESFQFSVSQLISNPGLYYLWRSATVFSYGKTAIAGQTICNGYFSTDEDDEKVLNWYKKQYPWLFPDQAWTVTGKTNEDEDRATIANITGNGNDLVLSNLGFAEGSGYGLYAQNYISYAITNRAVYTKTNSSIHVTKSITAGGNFTESARDVTIPSYRIKVTGIQSGQEMIYGGSNNTFLTNIPSDGIYVLPAVENGSNLGFQFVSYTGDCDITIEQIPEYEGYLVTDGVDDKIVSSVFGMGKDFTIVGEWKFIDNKRSNTGLVKGSSFYIYNTMIGLDLYINSGSVRNSLDGIKSINAACSDGRAYDRNWNEILANTGNVVGSGGILEVSSSGGRFDRIAFKNLAIYPRILSKDDCIKAYNYLQTLKAK